MKKHYFIYLLLAILFIANSSFAQLSETTMKDILESTSDKIRYLEDIQDKEVVNVTIDLLVGLQGEKMLYRNLDNGFDYNLVAFGDRRISELKIEVNRKSGEKWIKVDNVTGANPELEIFPDERALYEFIIKVNSFKEGNSAGHFALLLYHRDPLKDKSK